MFPNQPRVMSNEDFKQMQDALRDPDYVRRMLADAKAADMVEVDNPFRREVRPRRGRE